METVSKNNWYYVRVSTPDQNPERQFPDVSRESPFLITEHASGASGKSRPLFEALVDRLAPGDTLHVWELSRLGRSNTALLATIEKIVYGKKANLVVVQAGLHILGGENMSAISKLQLGLFALMAEFERTQLRERQMEGYLALRLGKRKMPPGRWPNKAPMVYPQDVKQRIIDQAKTDLRQGYDELAKMFNVSRTTVRRFLHGAGVKLDWLPKNVRHLARISSDNS